MQILLRISKRIGKEMMNCMVVVEIAKFDLKIGDHIFVGSGLSKLEMLCFVDYENLK